MTAQILINCKYSVLYAEEIDFLLENKLKILRKAGYEFDINELSVDKKFRLLQIGYSLLKSFYIN